MTVLMNPYRLDGPNVAGVLGRRAKIMGAAAFGALLAAGCSSGEEPEPATSPPPVTMPVPTSTSPPPTPSETPAPGSADASEDGAAADGGDGAAEEPVPAAASGAVAAPGQVQLTKPGADYTVMPGDTLSHLALQFGVPGGWPALFECNRDVLWNPDLILVGQELDFCNG
ncbi:MAG TPA: LysM domain-containing protein [Pseudonocardia sp.]|nr:LysM domain-containing protein [Pseudonocardia sp.]